MLSDRPTIHFRVTEDIHDQLVAHAEKHRRSLAGLVRIIIEDWLSAQEKGK